MLLAKALNLEPKDSTVNLEPTEQTDWMLPLAMLESTELLESTAMPVLLARTVCPVTSDLIPQTAKSVPRVPLA